MKWPALLIVVMVLGNFFFAAGFGPLLEPLLYTMTPFERYYAGDYLASTWKANDPSATTDTRLLWKSRPVPGLPAKAGATSAKSKKTESKIETAFAAARDVEPRPLGDRLGKYSVEPFTLSEQARAEGWTGVYRGRSQKVPSGTLQSLLEEEVYGGETLWRFFVQPAVGAGGLIVLLFALRLWRRRLLARHPWRSCREAAWLQMRAWSAASAGRLSEGMRRPMRELEGAKPWRELPAPQPDSVAVAPVASAAAAKPEAPAAPQPVAVPAPRKAYVWSETEGID